MVIKTFSRCSRLFLFLILFTPILLVRSQLVVAQGVIQGGEEASGSIGQPVGGGGGADFAGTSDGPPKENIPTTAICQEGAGTDSVSTKNCDCEGETLNAENCDIIKYIQAGINFLSAAAALAIVGGMMWAGYMYMTARDNPGQTAAARQRVVWALVSLLVLIFFYGALQWLVPGGVI